jgi:MFS family permease
MKQPIESQDSFSMLQLKVIVASCLGATFELYDFSLYVTMAPYIARHFYSSLPPNSSFLMALFTFAAGYTLRPFGAILFGYLGDKIGRKYSFLATIIIMGASTFLVGVLPTYNTIGIAAPILLLILRSLQGIAMGGEYGGAVVYVAEHAPKDRRGLYTGVIQASGFAGFLSSVLVVVFIEGVMKREAFEVEFY